MIHDQQIASNRPIKRCAVFFGATLLPRDMVSCSWFSVLTGRKIGRLNLASRRLEADCRDLSGASLVAGLSLKREGRVAKVCREEFQHEWLKASC